MKVRELIEILQQADQDIDVVLSRDAEGNGFNLLIDVDTERTIDNHNEIHLRALTQYHIDNGYTDEDLDQTGTGRPCVVLWP